MVEVFQVLVRADPSTHGADIETEQGTSDRAKGSED
jgi:hypothetical protein